MGGLGLDERALVGLWAGLLFTFFLFKWRQWNKEKPGLVRSYGLDGLGSVRVWGCKMRCLDCFPPASSAAAAAALWDDTR